MSDEHRRMVEMARLLLSGMMWNDESVAWLLARRHGVEIELARKLVKQAPAQLNQLRVGELT